jgi:hypothetical protein
MAETEAEKQERLSRIWRGRVKDLKKADKAPKKTTVKKRGEKKK